MAAHKGPICRAKTEARKMKTKSKDKQIDVHQWGGRFDYPGYFDCASHCYIKVVGNVVLCTESPANEGTSITSRAEVIATLVCRERGIPLDQVTWIEHYVVRPVETSGETFDLVKFETKPGPHGAEFSHFAHPAWSHIEKGAALTMLGLSGPGE
jgi:hypothetical protein